MAAKKKAKKKAKSKAKPQEMLIVSSKVKAAIKGAGCNTSGDALEGLNGIIYWYIDQATQRAAANGRKTVRNHDFVIM